MTIPESGDGKASGPGDEWATVGSSGSNHNKARKNLRNKSSDSLTSVQQQKPNNNNNAKSLAKSTSGSNHNPQKGFKSSPPHLNDNNNNNTNSNANSSNNSNRNHPQQSRPLNNVRSKSFSVHSTAAHNAKTNNSPMISNHSAHAAAAATTQSTASHPTHPCGISPKGTTPTPAPARRSNSPKGGPFRSNVARSTSLTSSLAAAVNSNNSNNKGLSYAAASARSSSSAVPPAIPSRKGKAPKRAHSYAGPGTQPTFHNKSNNNNNSSTTAATTYRPKPLDDIDLWTNLNTSSSNRHVHRYSSDTLLSQRMIFTDAPVAVEWWTPYEKCWWDDDDSRVERIANEQALYFNFQPLSVNEATRWKRRQERLSQQEPIQLEENADDNLIRPAETEAAILAILNKLSWTNIDKLTPQFIEGLSVNKDQRIADLSISKPDSSVASATVSPSLVRSTMAIVVDKAMLEPHFAALYAKLTVNLSQCHKLFKKTVLSLCQEQFEATGREDSDRKTDDLVTAQTTESAATSNGNNLGQQKSLALLARKKSIGLMIFIGELYVMRLIKVEIMISCCERLLVPDDEEKLESFCKLMTTIGKRLYEQENEQKSVASSNGHTNSNSSASHLWKTVYGMAGKPQPNGQSVPNVVVPSTRIKFLLQALVELKENNWTQVRHEHEKAKTLSQIHAQVAAEAKRGPITKTASAVLKRAQSGGSLFQTTSGGTFSKGPDGTSDQSLQQSTVISSEHSDGFSTVPAKPIRDKLRRAKSEVSGSAAATLQYQQRMGAPFVSHMPCTLQQQQEQSPPVRMPYAMSAVAIHNYRPRLPSHSEDDFVVDSDPQPWDRDEVGDRTKTLLKEYFVNGNLREAMTLVDEMVLGGGIVPAADRVERGVAVVQTGVLMVMEMKDEQVGKFLQVISKCLDDQMLDPASLIVALSDPLDFLRDIEIDAPLAGRLLATIVASWLEKKVNDNGMTAIPSLEALIQQAPDGFCLGDARPAEFVAQILMQRSGEVTDAEYAVLAAVMNENETKEFPSAQDFFQSCSKR